MVSVLLVVSVIVSLVMLGGCQQGAEGEKVCTHDWIPYGCMTVNAEDCAVMEICNLCGETRGGASGHSWVENWERFVSICVACGLTKDIIIEPVYLNEMDFVDKAGKLWTRSAQPVSYLSDPDTSDLSVWEREDIPGHSVGEVYDNHGNRYRYGLHLDGAESKTYYITYDLGGRYRMFTGWCAFPGSPLSKHADKAKKKIEIYADGELVYTTQLISKDSQPEHIQVDVTGVHTLVIAYPQSKQVNEAATLFDGMLS